MKSSKDISINWTSYFKYKLELRVFDQLKVENILRYSDERYFDIVSQNNIVIGKHDRRLVLIPMNLKKM